MNTKWTGKLVCGLIGLFLGGPAGLIAGLVIGHVFFDATGRKSGKAWGGLLGLMFAGPIGAIAGIYLGNAFDRTHPERSRVDDRSLFQIHLITILAYVVKVDHEVKEEEINVILSVFRRMGMNDVQMEVLQRTIRFALTQPIDLETTCIHFQKAATYEECLMLLRVVHMVVMADGAVHANERRAIDEIARYLKIHAEDLASLQGEFSQTTDRNYEILGLKRGATRMEVKRAYRKLALTHHPDRVSHLGKEYADIAKDKFQKINNAYHEILKELASS